MQQYLPAIIKGLFIIFVIGAPVLSAIAKSIREKAKKREAQQRAMQREREFQRTGGIRPGESEGGASLSDGSILVNTGPVPEVDAKRRLQELARQRRAELEALARQTQASPSTLPASASPRPQAAPSGSRSAPPVRPAQQPARPMVRQPARQVMPLPPQQRAARSPKPSRVSGNRPLSPPVRPQQRASTDVYEAAPGGHMHAVADQGESVVHRLVKDSPTTAVLPSGRPALLAGLRSESGAINPDALADLRRAIALREVLDLPVSLRD